MGAIVKGINNAANFADRLDELSKALDVNVEDLSVWGDAVKLNGGTAEGFQDTVKQMTASLADFATKGTSRTAPFFQALGIQMVDATGKARNFFEILPELSDAFQKLGRQQSFGIGQKLGLDQGTIMLLQQGSKEVDRIIKRQKELGVVTKLDAEIAAKFNDAWDDTAHAFRSVFLAIGAYVLPGFTKVLSIVERVGLWFKSHSDFIIGAVIALGTAVAVFLVPPLIRAAAAALVLYAPFLLIGAAVAALVVGFGLLYDDIQNFLAGNKSAIGYIVEKWPLVGEILIGLIKVAKQLWAALQPVFDFIGDGLKGIFNLGVEIIEVILKAIGGIVTGISKALGLYEKIKGFATNGEDRNLTVTQRLRKELGGEDVEQNISAANRAVSVANATPLNAQNLTDINSARTANNKTINVQTGPITVTTQATDAQGISFAFSGELKNAMRQTISAYDDGILA